MMATEEGNVADWDPVVDEGGKLLSDVAIGTGATSGSDISDKKVAPQPVAMCGFLSLDFYRPYFDVDTSQVKTRLYQAVWPKAQGPPFLEDSDAAPAMPDMYGPVWVSATLVFALSVVSNSRRDTEDGKFDDVMRNIYLVLGYLAVGSAGLWGFFRTHNVPLSPPEAVSVYGYSLTSFVLVAPLCVLAWPIRWLVLAAASACAAVFVLGSAWPRLQETTPEKSSVVLLGAVSAFHVVWFLFLAFS